LEKFRSLNPAYLRDAHCAVVVYDITIEGVFDGVKAGILMFNNYKRHDATIIVVCNKTDLKVTQETAFEFTIKGHVGYSEVSAKKGEGIEMP
jgi:GTPase SAR1 family protein